MRSFGLLLAGVLLCSAVGCLAPYSWPTTLPTAEPEAAAAPANTPINPDEALTKAAELLDQGKDADAVPYLRSYVQANPDAVMVRAHLAELLFRQGEVAESRQQFETFVDQAQPLTGGVRQHLVHVHTRLMELASRSEESFAEELHRGIGLLLLVKKWRADPDRRDADTEEQTLMKAVRALRDAVALNPSDPRGQLYLAEAYTELGQIGPAEEAFRLAVRQASLGTLTPNEQARLDSIERQFELHRR